MKTKRNKKQKNRSFRKNRSFKKKGLKKNPTRKNVGGHLMGFDLNQNYELPEWVCLGGTHDRFDYYFTVHSFKHLDTFLTLNELKEHDDIKYPICKVDGMGNGLACPAINEVQINHTIGNIIGDHNINTYIQLATKAFHQLGLHFDLDSINQWKRNPLQSITRDTGVIVFNNPDGARSRFDDYEPTNPRGPKLHLVLEPITNNYRNIETGNMIRRGILVREFSYKTDNANYALDGNINNYFASKYDLELTRGGATTILIPSDNLNPNNYDISYNTVFEIDTKIQNSSKFTANFGNVSLDTIDINGTIANVGTTVINNLNQSINIPPNLFRNNISRLRITANINHYGGTTTKTYYINPIYPQPQELGANVLNINDTSNLDDNFITISVNRQNIIIKNDPADVGELGRMLITYRNPGNAAIEEIISGTAIENIHPINVYRDGGTVRIRAISNLNEQIRSNPTELVIPPKITLSFSARLRDRTTQYQQDNNEPYVIQQDSLISITPTIPPTVNAIIRQLSTNDPNAQINDAQDIGIPLQNNTSFDYQINTNRKYKILFLEQILPQEENNVVVRRIIRKMIFAVVNFSNPTCIKNTVSTKFEGKIQNVAEIKVMDGNNQIATKPGLNEKNDFNVTLDERLNNQTYNVVARNQDVIIDLAANCVEDEEDICKATELRDYKSVLKKTNFSGISPKFLITPAHRVLILEVMNLAVQDIQARLRTTNDIKTFITSLFTRFNKNAPSEAYLTTFFSNLLTVKKFFTCLSTVLPDANPPPPPDGAAPQ
jgi:hypothetical protein